MSGTSLPIDFLRILIQALKMWHLGFGEQHHNLKKRKKACFPLKTCPSIQTRGNRAENRSQTVDSARRICIHCSWVENEHDSAFIIHTKLCMNGREFGIYVAPGC